MKVTRFVHAVVIGAILSIAALGAGAAEYPAPKEADWIARKFRFHTGEVMRELRLHYTTVGAPGGEPVLILHGTAQSGDAMLTPGFAGELFGAGQPLDAQKYFIILPDAIGAGKSSRPSDGLRAAFPQYDYDDMVAAQYRLVTEGLGVRHLRLLLGNSMGGMHTWLWGVTHPDVMDALVPMASQPTAMASRNWMLRRLLVETIRDDPDWNGGNYVAQPRSMRMASVFYGIATNGGSLGWQALAPTSEQADAIVRDALAAPFDADANDFIHQFEASRDYDASPGLERIEAAVLAINSADDERDPPETGLMQRALARVKHGRLYLIPASAETRGHGTAGMARFWKDEFEKFLAEVPYRAGGSN